MDGDGCSTAGSGGKVLLFGQEPLVDFQYLCNVKAQDPGELFLFVQPFVTIGLRVYAPYGYNSTTLAMHNINSWFNIL